MGTIRSGPEPVIEHLAKGHSQSREHRWKQFTSGTGGSGTRFHLSLTSFRGWQLQGKHLCLETASFGMFSKPWSSEWGEWFLLYYWIVNSAFLRWSETGSKQLYLLSSTFTESIEDNSDCFWWETIIWSRKQIWKYISFVLNWLEVDSVGAYRESYNCKEG